MQQSATIITFVFGYLLHFHVLWAFLQYYYEYILLKQGLTYINVHCNVHGLPKTFCVIYCHFKNEIDFLTKMQFLSKVVFLLTKKKLHKVSLKCYLIWTSYWKFEFSTIDEKLSTSFCNNMLVSTKHSNHIFQGHWKLKIFLKNINVPTYLQFIISKCHIYIRQISGMIMELKKIDKMELKIHIPNGSKLWSHWLKTDVLKSQIIHFPLKITLP